MSKDWVKDIQEMHQYYGHTDAFKDLTLEQQRALIKFRIDFLQEELDEIKDNIDNPEEIIDGIIDLCVVAIGTLDAFEIDSHKAWNEVLKANMNKKTGIKEGRPNPLGLPDLMKPDGWEPPSHKDNHGSLTYIV